MPPGLEHCALPLTSCRLLTFLHLHETVGAWQRVDLHETEAHPEQDAMMLEHRPSGARLSLAKDSNGFIDFKQSSGAPWQTAYSSAYVDVLDPESIEGAGWDAPFPDPSKTSLTHPPLTLAVRVWLGYVRFGPWRFDIRQSGLEVLCTEDIRHAPEDGRHPLPSLLSADGALLKECVPVGFVGDTADYAARRQELLGVDGGAPLAAAVGLGEPL